MADPITPRLNILLWDGNVNLWGVIAWELCVIVPQTDRADVLKETHKMLILGAKLKFFSETENIFARKEHLGVLFNVNPMFCASRTTL